MLSEQGQAVLVIFCKRPRLGQGKQRLAQTIGTKKALEIARLLLACALEDAKAWSGLVVLSPSEQSDHDWAASLLADHPNCLVLPQQEGNLGQRINLVDKSLRALGHHNLVFIGTDAPVLDAEFYQQAIESMRQNDVVLSRADDGGVTLMGSNQAWPDLSTLSWSTQSLADELHQTCEKSDRRLSFIRDTYDIDLIEDLKKLQKDLQGDNRITRQNLLKTISVEAGLSYV